ncbi:MAG: hypothetical protein ACK5LS_00060 [Propioniciclava sp.]
MGEGLGGDVHHQRCLPLRAGWSGAGSVQQFADRSGMGEHAEGSGLPLGSGFGVAQLAECGLGVESGEQLRAAVAVTADVDQTGLMLLSGVLLGEGGIGPDDETLQAALDPPPGHGGEREAVLMVDPLGCGGAEPCLGAPGGDAERFPRFDPAGRGCLPQLRVAVA